jgi:hypothetical protein
MYNADQLIARGEPISPIPIIPIPIDDRCLIGELACKSFEPSGQDKDDQGWQSPRDATDSPLWNERGILIESAFSPANGAKSGSGDPLQGVDACPT